MKALCTAAQRVYVQEKIYDPFVAGIAEAAKKIKLGHGFDPATEMGPHPFEGVVDTLGVSHVTFIRQALDPKLIGNFPGYLLDLLTSPRRCRHARAVARERKRDRAPNPATAAGNQS